MTDEEIEEAVRVHYVEEAAQYRDAATRWLPYAMRNDSLGETARRRHLHCLHMAWRAEAIAAR
ncbi:hypothetical protein AB0M68_03710 [Streptomyces sp. NPDC051453]|uniref:hypothetical protein n=1 Tax=Streptomyces sp. NPDC051453 TaxID=3154941 RepID=UPI00341D8705